MEIDAAIVVVEDYLLRKIELFIRQCENPMDHTVCKKKFVGSLLLVL